MWSRAERQRFRCPEQLPVLVDLQLRAEHSLDHRWSVVPPTRTVACPSWRPSLCRLADQRQVLLEAGHMAQNMLSDAVAHVRSSGRYLRTTDRTRAPPPRAGAREATEGRSLEDERDL